MRPQASLALCTHRAPDAAARARDDGDLTEQQAPRLEARLLLLRRGSGGGRRAATAAACGVAALQGIALGARATLLRRSQVSSKAVETAGGRLVRGARHVGLRGDGELLTACRRTPIEG
jgi:hypothetical protein